MEGTLHSNWSALTYSDQDMALNLLIFIIGLHVWLCWLRGTSVLQRLFEKG